MCLCLTCNDKPGNHNFELVLPPGSVLRAELPGRPTRDCLSAGPARDGTSLLEIWNVSKCAGVVAVLNCQGAGWCRVTKMTRVHDAAPGDAHPIRLPKGATLPVTLKVLESEPFHVSLVRAVAETGVSFAPVSGCSTCAYCSRRPARCALDAAEVEFSYDADTDGTDPPQLGSWWEAHSPLRAPSSSRLVWRVAT
ncbi:hypothetical protein SETIT_4G184900v2 [Setaria italica]|uniref:Uncharacterized protein n=1 Tax=Setaria italica TaxID=4555 RepID=K3Y1F5_SETIT|nr:hypothetical protein SETIT_4G184900v2 [Setaria italica]